MESSVKIKNISILSLFFLLGFLSNIFLTHFEDIDIYTLFSQLKRETVIEEVVEKEEESTVVVQKEEEKEEIDTCPILVDISGAVKSPGVYCFEKGASVVDSIKKAKGFTLDAGFKYIAMRINLATEMVDNSKIYIPFESDYDCKLLNFNLPKDVIDITIPDTPSNDASGGNTECVSINSGTTEQLQTLVGVGPSTAQKIIDGRPYSELEDLLNVSGIGEITFNKFKDAICL